MNRASRRGVAGRGGGGVVRREPPAIGPVPSPVNRVVSGWDPVSAAPARGGLHGAFGWDVAPSAKIAAEVLGWEGGSPAAAADVVAALRSPGVGWSAANAAVAFAAVRDASGCGAGLGVGAWGCRRRPVGRGRTPRAGVRPTGGNARVVSGRMRRAVGGTVRVRRGRAGGSRRGLARLGRRRGCRDARRVDAMAGTRQGRGRRRRETTTRDARVERRGSSGAPWASWRAGSTRSTTPGRSKARESPRRGFRGGGGRGSIGGPRRRRTTRRGRTTPPRTDIPRMPIDQKRRTREGTRRVVQRARDGAGRSRDPDPRRWRRRLFGTRTSRDASGIPW